MIKLSQKHELKRFVTIPVFIIGNNLQKLSKINTNPLRF